MLQEAITSRELPSTQATTTSPLSSAATAGDTPLALSCCAPGVIDESESQTHTLRWPAAAP
jgi:hypothetical protein